MDAVYCGFNKAFDTVCYNILTDKLTKYGQDKGAERWTEIWLNCCTQRVMNSGTKPSWRPISVGVRQRLILGQAPLNIFVNNLDNRTECTLSKFAEDA